MRTLSSVSVEPHFGTADAGRGAATKGDGCRSRVESVRDAGQSFHTDLRFPLATGQVIGVMQVDLSYPQSARAALHAARQRLLVIDASGAGA